MAVFSFGMTTTITFSIAVFAKTSCTRLSMAAGLDRSEKPISSVSRRRGWTSPPSSVYAGRRSALPSYRMPALARLG